MVTQRIDYSKPPRFNNYHCASCAAGGVKLWRLVYAANTTIGLKCARCLASAAGASTTQISPDRLARITDAIDPGQVEPAIPADMDGGAAYAYWGVSSVPQAGLDWWQSLPLMKR